MIHNNLDKMTIEDVLKYAVQGYEFQINDGHVQAMSQTKQQAEDPKDGGEV